MGNWDKLREELDAYCKENRGALTELANHLDAHYQSVQKWLAGDVMPSYEIGAKMKEWLEGRK